MKIWHQLATSQEMSKKHKMSGMSALLTSPDFKFLNILKKNTEHARICNVPFHGWQSAHYIFLYLILLAQDLQLIKIIILDTARQTVSFLSGFSS